MINNLLSDNQYFKEKQFKNQIVIHHTAGGSSAVNTIHGWNFNPEKVGTAFVIDGKIWGGANNFAGEIGQTIIDGNEIDRNKTLERAGSGGAILRDSGRLAADLQKEADQGNLDSKRILTEAGKTLGLAIFNQIQILDPEVCVLGGGLALGSDTYWQAVTDTLKSAESNSVKRRYLVERSFLGSDAVILGAVELSNSKEGLYYA